MSKYVLYKNTKFKILGSRQVQLSQNQSIQLIKLKHPKYNCFEVNKKYLLEINE